MPIATPTANSSGRLAKRALPAAPRTAATLSQPEAVGPEQVGLAEPQQQRGGGEGGDRQHQAAAELLDRRQVELPGRWCGPTAASVVVICFVPSVVLCAVS